MFQWLLLIGLLLWPYCSHVLYCSLPPFLWTHRRRWCSKWACLEGVWHWNSISVPWRDFQHGPSSFLFLCVICHCFPEPDRRLASHRWEINMSAGKNPAAEHLFLYWKKKDLEQCSGLGGKGRNRQTPAASFVAPVIRLKNKACLSGKKRKNMN